MRLCQERKKEHIDEPHIIEQAFHLSTQKAKEVNLYEFEANLVCILSSKQPMLLSNTMCQTKYTNIPSTKKIGRQTDRQTDNQHMKML